MICKQCGKGNVDKFKLLEICNACNTKNYNKKHPENHKYKYGGMKAEVFRSYNYKCALCRNIKNLCVHHIDGNGTTNNGKLLKSKEQNNNINNLILVCCKCHSKLHEIGNPITVKKWSNKFDKCINCGTIKRKHTGKGLCQKCRYRIYADNHKAELKDRRAEWYQKRGKYLRAMKKLSTIQPIDNNIVK